MIKWQEVRAQFPNRCVLVEALNAKTRGNERLIDEMSVISDFDNGNDAWKSYRRIHEENKLRELYIFHTNNKNITVIEQPYIGVRRKI
jgi:hypothetical protein